MRSTDGNISGLQKAAVLLIALGPEQSASVFKHLKEEEIEELHHHIQRVVDRRLGGCTIVEHHLVGTYVTALT